MVAAGRRIALAACAAFAVLGPGAAGAQPPVTALDEIFSPDKGGVPYPFEALVKALEDRIAPARLRTALVPIGRSLQRFGADPDYFGSPRIVIAVDSDPADGPALKDRLFVGYQPAAGIVEAISYSAASGRFEFRTVEDYGSGKPDLFTPAERDICMRCHQGGAPIFSTPLWGETNGNAAIAARLKPLGTTFHGVPVVQGSDGPDAFDQAVDIVRHDLAALRPAASIEPYSLFGDLAEHEDVAAEERSSLEYQLEAVVVGWVVAAGYLNAAMHVFG